MSGASRRRSPSDEEAGEIPENDPTPGIGARHGPVTSTPSSASSHFSSYASLAGLPPPVQPLTRSGSTATTSNRNADGNSYSGRSSAQRLIIVRGSSTGGGSSGGGRAGSFRGGRGGTEGGRGSNSASTYGNDRAQPPPPRRFSMGSDSGYSDRNTSTSSVDRYGPPLNESRYGRSGGFESRNSYGGAGASERSLDRDRDSYHGGGGRFGRSSGGPRGRGGASPIDSIDVSPYGPEAGRMRHGGAESSSSSTRGRGRGRGSWSSRFSEPPRVGASDYTSIATMSEASTASTGKRNREHDGGGVGGSNMFSNSNNGPMLEISAPGPANKRPRDSLGSEGEIDERQPQKYSPRSVERLARSTPNDGFPDLPPSHPQSPRTRFNSESGVSSASVRGENERERGRYEGGGLPPAAMRFDNQSTSSGPASETPPAAQQSASNDLAGPKDPPGPSPPPVPAPPLGYAASGSKNPPAAPMKRDDGNSRPRKRWGAAAPTQQQQQQPPFCEESGESAAAMLSGAAAQRAAPPPSLHGARMMGRGRDVDSSVYGGNRGEGSFARMDSFGRGASYAGRGDSYHSVGRGDGFSASGRGEGGGFGGRTEGFRGSVGRGYVVAGRMAGRGRGDMTLHTGFSDMGRNGGFGQPYFERGASGVPNSPREPTSSQMPSSTAVRGDNNQSENSQSAVAGEASTLKPAPAPPPARESPPPPEPSAPSGRVLALTRLADMEAELEFAYAKHMLLKSKQRCLRAQTTLLESLNIGIEAFEDDLKALENNKSAASAAGEAQDKATEAGVVAVGDSG